MSGWIITLLGAYAWVAVNGVEFNAYVRSEAVSAGSPVLLTVRPEKIALDRQPLPEGDNNFLGRIEEAVYLGTDTRYTVRLGDRLQVTVRRSGMRIGSPVEWSLDGSAYGRMLDPLYLRIVLRSVGLALCTTAICLILGYPPAYYIARTQPGRRYLLYFMVLIPLWANSLETAEKIKGLEHLYRSD